MGVGNLGVVVNINESCVVSFEVMKTNKWFEENLFLKKIKQTIFCSIYYLKETLWERNGKLTNKKWFTILKILNLWC